LLVCRSTSPYIAGQVFVDLRGLEEAPDGLADDFGPAKLPDSVQDRYLDAVQAQGMVETMLKKQNVDPEDAVAWVTPFTTIINYVSTNCTAHIIRQAAKSNLAL
jgi:hypothetical protein